MLKNGEGFRKEILLYTLQGDLIKMAKECKFDVIVHGCNCFCTMGAGIALKIKENFPEAYEADKKTVYGDYKKMGTYTSAVHFVGNDRFPLLIINAYTQFTYKGIPGVDKNMRLSYTYLKECLYRINKKFSGSGLKIGLPKIGCGLAGGSWSKVSKIIEREFKDLDYTVVIYDKDDKK